MFPKHAWKRCARKALSVYDGDLGYARAAGLRSLQDAIAGHLRQFRGISVQPEQIVVVEGAQAALHLIASVLRAPGMQSSSKIRVTRSRAPRSKRTIELAARTGRR